MKINVEQVEKIASLARIGLSPEELQKFTHQLDAILGYVEQLNELDTSGVEATAHAVPLDCPMRSDEMKTSFPRESILARAPLPNDEFFMVPKIIE